MERVSTNFTLLIKLFIPTFWIVFFGTFTIAIWLTDLQGIGSEGLLKFGVTAFFIIGVLLFYWFVMRLKRVEMDADFLYATNYFKHYRYPWHNIEKIEELDYFLFNVVHIHLKEVGRFGKKITFIPSKRRLQDFLNDHPTLAAELLQTSSSS